MDEKFKPCPYCMNKMLKPPKLEKHQGLFSILCPYCLYCRGEWMPTVEEAVKAWNNNTFCGGVKG